MRARAAGQPDSKPRSRLVVALLLASLALVASLAYQAISAARSQAATARQLLTEYTRLAAEEFTRRASVEVGYYGLYLLGAELRRRAGEGGPAASLDPAALAASADPQLQRAATLARAVYWLHESGSVPGALGAELSRLVHPAPQTRQASAFTVRQIVLEGRRRSVALLPTGGRLGAANGWLAIEIEDSVLPEWFEAALNRGSLLPAVSGAMPADGFHLRVTDPDRSTVFTSGVAAQDALIVENEFRGDYGGLFDGYRVAVAIDPAAAARLVVGGLPADRVPMLIALLLVAVALLIAAILQVRRERALIETRSDFIARTSHELRTPLTQIRMFAETLLLERVRDPSDRRRFMGIILREAERLGQLVENILHFSRAGRSHAERREVLTLAPPTREVVADFEPLAAQAGIHIDCRVDESARARIDRDAWRQLLLNLLDNAAKYAPQGRVLVTIESLPGRVSLAVEDQGPGIPPGEAEKVFERFYRLSRERDAGTGGTGIGLAVVRELAREYGGDCRVDAAPQGGARLVVDLPAADGGPEARPA